MQNNINKKFNKLVKHFDKSIKDCFIETVIEECEVNVNDERNIIFESLEEETEISFDLSYSASYSYYSGDWEMPPYYDLLGSSLDVSISCVLYAGIDITKRFTSKQIDVLEELIFKSIHF